MRFTWPLTCLIPVILASCSSYEMPRASRATPESLPVVVMHPGVQRLVIEAERYHFFNWRTQSLPLAVSEDTQVLELDQDPESGNIYALALKPGRAIITYPREKDTAGMATVVEVKPPELKFPGRHDIPRYLRGHRNPATFATAVNHYIRMGESKACRELILISDLAKSDPDHFGTSSVDYGINDICRVLFTGSPKKPLRGAFLGASLMLPYRAMPPTTWPLLPLVEQNGIYFNIASGGLFIAGGLPEEIPDFLRYCRKEGSFRLKPIKIPDQNEAMAAAEAFKKSSRWSSLPEKAALYGGTVASPLIEDQIRVQARIIY